jgi:hypothetical protein
MAGAVVLTVVLTLISGFADAYGFIHASSMWEDGRLVAGEFARSAAGFAVGISSYWLVVRYLNQLGVTSAAVQTIGWFGTTIVGVAIAEGEFGEWSRTSQAVAVLVVAGIGWLLVNEG